MAQQQASKTQKVFVYTGKYQDGSKAQGEISAENQTIAAAMLRRQDIKVSKLKQKSKSLINLGKKTKVAAEDIAMFMRQMATMAAAGVPLVQGLQVIIDGSEHEGLSKLIKKVKEDVEGGNSFSQALKKHPLLFDDLLCNLVESGEQSGSLDTMLDRIATYKEKLEALKRKIKKAMVYPAAVVVIASVVTVILLIKVVPTFKDMFGSFGAELPGFTLFVLKISDALQEHGGKVLGIVVMAVIALVQSYRRNINVRHAFERYIIRFPILGPILRKAIVARFARTLSTTFAAGVPLTDALTSVAKASGNVVYYNAIIQIRDDVATGQHMRAAILKTQLFPHMLIQMVGIGEESGTLDDMLAKVATIVEDEVDTAVDGLTTLLEPLIMVILGVVVGGLVVAMYLPIFKLGSVL